MFFLGVKWLLLRFFLWQATLFSSVCMKTLIKTSQGSLIAENLTRECEVIGYSAEKNQFLHSVIMDVIPVLIDSVVEITTEDGRICAACGQLFFDSVLQKWIVAKDLTSDNYFLNAQLCHVKCLDVRCICIMPTTAYRISTTFPHTFFVTEQELLTHNFFPVVMGVSWLFGLGSIEFAGFNIAAIVAETAIGMKLFKSKKHKHKNSESRVVVKPYIQGASGGFPDPNDDDSEKKKRKFNTVSKSEFFRRVEDQYEHWKKGIYRRKRGAKGIENAEYLEWDHLHGDVEAYHAGRQHIGSISPASLKIYKSAVRGRMLTKI